MEGAHHFHLLSKHLIPELCFVIVEYLHGSMEFQRYHDEINLFVDAMPLNNAIDKFLDRNINSDCVLASVIKHKVLYLETILNHIKDYDKLLNRYPLVVEQVLSELRSRKTLAGWSELVRFTQVNDKISPKKTIDDIMKLWQSLLNPADYQKVVQIRAELNL